MRDHALVHLTSWRAHSRLTGPPFSDIASLVRGLRCCIPAAAEMTRENTVVAMPKMSVVDLKSMLAQAVAKSDREMEIFEHTPGNGSRREPAEATS
jgi:hypothetical protein